MGRKQSAIFSDNRLKLGLFSLNCSGGMSVTMAPERWVNRRLRALGGVWALLALAAGAVAAPAAPPAPREGDFTIQDFRFASGETLPALRLHYRTLGTPRRDAAGHVINAVLILHGTDSSGGAFLQPTFGGELFGAGQLLDNGRYFLILPDDIGHGRSSKPSDGLHARFPHYDYADMVEAEHRLVTEGLGVDRLRLILGASMGGMHAFLWGEMWPDKIDALMPMACAPVSIVGRNRLFRLMIVDAVKSDPAWQGGNYTEQPRQALRTIADLLALALGSPQQMQKELPTPAAVDRYFEDLQHNSSGIDANDILYAVSASDDYDPSAGLERITAPVMWVNSADDFINPPELDIAETQVKRLKNGRFVLLPLGPNTHGHGTYKWAIAWKSYLGELLKRSDGQR